MYVLFLTCDPLHMVPWTVDRSSVGVRWALAQPSHPGSTLADFILTDGSSLWQCLPPWLWLLPPFWDTLQVSFGANGRKLHFLPQEIVWLGNNMLKD